MVIQELMRASLAFALSVMIAGTADAQTFTCAPTSDANVVAFRAHVVRLVTATDTGATARRTMYNVPQTTAAKVAFVARVQTCTAAGQAYYTALGVTPPVGATPVAVLKVSNNRYVVVAQSHREGEFEVTVTFDSKWKALGEVAS